MTQNKSPESYKKEALTVMVQWRGADRHAINNKSDPDAQRAEYKFRKHMRTAADNLTEVRHSQEVES